MDRVALAETHFKWFSESLCRQFGQDAEEHAGVAFMRVLDQFDDSKGGFRPFARRAMSFAYKTEYSSLHGRVGSRKRLAESGSVSSDTMDVAVDESESSIVKLLQQVDDTYDKLIAKSVAVCKVLGMFDDEDTAFIVGRRSLRGVASRM